MNRIRSREWYRNNTDRARLTNRKAQLKKYDITPEEFEVLRAKQSGKCAICDKYVPSTLCVDHDHETGEIRGLLCRSCNLAVGMLGDSADGLAKAHKYLLNTNYRVV